MPNIAGMYQLTDLLAVRNASAASFGLDNINQTLQMEVQYANDRVNEMLADLAQPMNVQSAIWGSGGAVLMEEMDEFGVPLPSHSAPGITAQFPLRMYKQTIGWTEEYFQQATPAEVAEKFLELRKGYFQALTKSMRRALYGYGNGTTCQYTFVDRLTNGVSLTVYPFSQGDVTVGTVPDSPAGATFANTHTHMLAENVVSGADINALIDTVKEHGNTKGLKLYVNAADIAAVAALTTWYTPLSEAIFAYAGVTSTILKKDNLDTENVMMGYWTGGVEVWVKPWAVDGYLLCVATGMPEKALGYRQRPQPALQGWRICATYSDHPLIAEYAKAEFGFGVFNRTMGGVNYMDNDTWANPSI
jgi:hypothetical protein